MSCMVFFFANVDAGATRVDRGNLISPPPDERAEVISSGLGSLLAEAKMEESESL
jgi:hypothetical protein